MANRIRTDDPRGFNEVLEVSRVRQTPEEQRTYQPKRRGNNNKDEDNSPKTLNDKNTYIYTTMSQSIMLASGTSLSIYNY